MQPSKLIAVAAVLLAAVATATAQSAGIPPDICTNKNAMWTPQSATCDFTCPDSSMWTLDCRTTPDGVQCKAASADNGPGAVDMRCGMPTAGGAPFDAVCSGTYAGITRTNNDCVMEYIRTVMFTWQEGIATAPAAEGP